MVVGLVEVLVAVYLHCSYSTIVSKDSKYLSRDLEGCIQM